MTAPANSDREAVRAWVPSVDRFTSTGVLDVLMFSPLGLRSEKLWPFQLQGLDTTSSRYFEN